MESILVIVVYNSLLLILVAGLLTVLWVTDRREKTPVLVLIVAAFPIASGFVAFVSPIDAFGKIQLLAWALLGQYPILLLSGASFLFRRRRRVAIGFIALAVVLLAVAAYAFLLEPRWLDVDHLRLTTSKLDTSVRVAVVADIQTDSPSRYERQVLRQVRVEEPDLILLAGDYVHMADPERYSATVESLNAILHEEHLEAPLGVYAVRGNVDRPVEWQQVFAGLPVTVFERSRTVNVGPLSVTGLALGDSANTSLVVAPRDGFHIVLGHTPNFSLGRVSADLLVAGHTHGGQVQLPFVGPVLTLSQVPRQWASGVTKIAPGRTLVVSRGIGMERANAPRMRFLCRPQLVIIDIVGTEDPSS